MRRVGRILLLVIGAYFVLRAVLEPLTIDMHDPDTYSKDWGGPSLAGVLTVHMAPGIIAAVLMAIAWRRWRASRRPAE